MDTETTTTPVTQQSQPTQLQDEQSHLSTSGQNQSIDSVGVSNGAVSDHSTQSPKENTSDSMQETATAKTPKDDVADSTSQKVNGEATNTEDGNSSVLHVDSCHLHLCTLQLSSLICNVDDDDEHRTVRLRSGLQRTFDYEILPEEAWVALQQWYAHVAVLQSCMTVIKPRFGGGPAIVRPVVAAKMFWLPPVVDLYPLHIRVVR